MSIQSNFPSVRPSLLLDFASTKQLDSRITYTRASTASYYDGVTTSKAEQNLSINSEVFSSWNNVGITVTDNSTTAPDGNTTADTIAGTSGVSYRANNVSITTGLAYTFSIYAKANATNFLQIVGGSSGFDGTTWANFDLSSGVVGSKGASATSTITSVGNGWYRCTMTATSTATGSSNVFAITPCEASTSGRFASLVGATSIYVWGAQVEQRSAVSAYTATTTQAITNYIPVLQTAASGVARFDNNPTTGESLGLLIEESRTNLVTYSSQFDNAAWTKSQSSITADTIVAPDGTLTGDKLVENTAATAQHYTYQLGKTITATSNTASVYLKAGERTSVYFVIYDGSNLGATFNLTSGTITSTDSGVTSSITSVGNGWYRCIITRTTSASANGGMSILPVVAGSTSYTGDGFSGVFIWGAQLEAGAFATSYIPTVASQVTRAADAASMTGTNFSTWFNNAEGTIYAEQTASGFSGANFVCAFTDNTSNNLIQIYYSSATNLRFDVNIANANIVALSLTSGITFPYTAKFDLGYKVNDFGRSVSGGAAVTSSSGALPVVSQLSIGNRNGANFFCGTIKKFAYYPIKATSAQLQALTS